MMNKRNSEVWNQALLLHDITYHVFKLIHYVCMSPPPPLPALLSTIVSDLWPGSPDVWAHLGKVSPRGSFPVRMTMQGSPSRSSYVCGTHSSFSQPLHAYSKTPLLHNIWLHLYHLELEQQLILGWFWTDIQMYFWKKVPFTISIYDIEEKIINHFAWK